MMNQMKSNKALIVQYLFKSRQQQMKSWMNKKLNDGLDQKN